MQIDFVRGHMGGNRIILLFGEQLPAGREMEIAVKLMGPNYLYAHEAGILYPADQPNKIPVNIVEPTLPSFISACGGLTQVFGTALVKTDIGARLGLKKEDLCSEIILQTEYGFTIIKIENGNYENFTVWTNMDSFLEECYEHGIGPLELSGLQVMRSGKFMLVNAERFRASYPEADFTNWNTETRSRLLAIQEQFLKQTGEVEPNVALYDWCPERDGDMRIVFPHYLRSDLIEPSCGTGTVALGVGLLAGDELQELMVKAGSRIKLRFESGGGIELGGPDLTTLELGIEDGRAKSAVFSHSRVEITATGKVMLE